MNVIGTRTLLEKEVRRFLRVPGQTILQPVVSTTLYFVVFGAMQQGRLVEGVPYVAYIVPGLVFLSVANNAFLNASSSFFICKIQGTMVDILVAPLGPLELLTGFILGGVVRGLLVGALTWGASMLFTAPHLAHPLWTLLIVSLSAWVFAVFGFMAAQWAEKFEQVNFFPTFLVTPLTFLGGVFFPVKALPELFRAASLFNPVVHMVEGLREGMLGVPASSSLGVWLLVSLAVVATALAWRLLASGYKLKT